MSLRTVAGTLSISLALSAGACTCVEKGRTFIEETRKRFSHVDEDYRFRISSPGAGWRLMPESEIRAVVPDALAGAMSKKGYLGLVVAEAAPSVELEAFAQLVIDGLDAENKEIESFEQVTFAGRDAYRFMVNGHVKGVHFRFVHHVFLNQGFAYQVFGWGLFESLDAEGKGLAPFFEAFELLDGPVRPRQVVAVQRDTHGVGWRLTGGAFESALTGLAVHPPKPWRVVVGEELATMNADAEVGLISSNPDVYAAILVEMAPERDREAFASYLYESLLTNLGGEALEAPWEAEVAGSKVTFRQFRTASPAIHYRHAVHFAQGRAYQLMVWHYVGLEERANEVLPAGLSAIRLLSDDESERLAETLAALPDSENTVGSGFSLRAGVYRSFQHGYRLKKGPGFWRFRTGAEARASNPDAELYFEEPRRGLYGLVVVIPSELEAGAVHEYTADATFEDPGDVTRVGPWWMSEGDSAEVGILLRYRLHTARHEDNIVQLWVWGRPSSMTDSASDVDALVAGFEFDPGMTAVETKDSLYRDQRLGFELRPPAGWKGRALTPKQLEEAATVMEWKSGNQEFGVLALCVLGQGRDEKWMMDFMTRTLETTIGQGLRGRPRDEPATFAGHSARRLTWPGKAGQKETRVYVVMRHQTVYGIFGSGDQKKTALAFKSFRLID